MKVHNHRHGQFFADTTNCQSTLLMGKHTIKRTLLLGFCLFLFSSCLYAKKHTNDLVLSGSDEIIFFDGFESLPLGADPSILLENAKMSFISNSYMGAWGGLNNYLELAVNASPITVTLNTLPARLSNGGWYWGMGLGSMTSALDRVEAEGDYDSCIFLDGPLQTMRAFADRLFAACDQVVLFADAGGHNPVTLGANHFNATNTTLTNARTMEAEYPNLLVIPTALIFYDLTINPPLATPRIDYLYGNNNIHQNGLGTLINAFSMYAVLSSRSPVGLEFEYDQPATPSRKFFFNDTVLIGYPFPSDAPEDFIVFDEATRNAFQQRIIQLLIQWQNSTTIFDL
ncbi:MAG: hypothetical protein L3J24_02155 [Xanthomonadales bacterium]|nr:hypothetical protein [Xanthomonadales bacterium]